MQALQDAPKTARRAAATLAAALALALAASACDTRNAPETAAKRDRNEERSEFPVPPIERADRSDPYSKQTRGVFGPKGITFGGGGRAEREESTGIGVSVYLWRASLDSLSHLPLRAADPFGGVIQTEWFEAPETPGERIRVDLRIQSRVLDANGVAASVFRQVRQDNEWRDATVAEDTGRKLENAILKRAREIRFAEATR